MKVGLDINKNQVFLEVSSGGGVTSTVDMSSKVARYLAEQLNASADALDTATENGYTVED